VVLFITAIAVPPGNAGNGAAQQDKEDVGFMVVVNAANPVVSLTLEEVSRFLLKKVSRWDNGQLVHPVDQSVDSTVRAVFTHHIHHREVDAVKRFWQQRIFAGRDTPPPVRPSDEEVIRYIEGNPGAVGYVSSTATLTEKVRQVALVGRDK